MSFEISKSDAVRTASALSRKSKIATGRTVKGDKAKFLSYAEAWARIRAAQRQGFFREAVAIQESIVSDRLNSFLVKDCAIDPELKALRSLHNLIGLWVKVSSERFARDSDCVASVDDLHERLDVWRMHRNEVVHGLVKSRAGRTGNHIDDFLERASLAAREGAILARQVCRWVDSARDELRVTIKV
jgi:hypothetical protein